MSGGVAITVDRLKKAFGEKTVLKEVSLDIPAGAFVSIVGKSGCGKSTLLRLLIGLEQATSGKIDAGAAAAARLVFQEPRLLPWASVKENVEVGLAGALQGEAASARALDALKLVGLGDRGGDWPAQLSGGQRQRVALARALVSHPRLLALDEPLGALDALTRIEMQTLVESVWKAEGFTALLVTHDVQEAIVLGDRVLLIEDGGISLDLTVDLPRPRRRGDAAFAALEGQVLDKLFGAGRPPGAH